MIDEWPSHMEELSRKAADQLDKWTAAYNAKKISKREYFLVINVLYDTTSGIVDDGLSSLLADIHADIRNGISSSAGKPE